MEQAQAYGFLAQVQADPELARELAMVEEMRERRVRLGALTIAVNYKKRSKCIDCDKQHATGCLRCQRCRSIRAGGDQPITHRSFVLTRAA